MYITRFTNGNNSYFLQNKSKIVRHHGNGTKQLQPVVQRTASCCLHQYTEAAGGVNLKQFTPKYQAFNNHVCVNIVFICKRVYFLTAGHQREMVQSLLTTCCRKLLLRDCWWEATLKHILTPNLHLKDTGIREVSISIGTVK